LSLLYKKKIIVVKKLIFELVASYMFECGDCPYKIGVKKAKGKKLLQNDFELKKINRKLALIISIIYLSYELKAI
jgi:hypothetical protein